MTKRIRSLLFEAYRRNEMADSHEQSKPLTKRWLGLGTEAAYRPAIQAGLMRFHDGRTPPARCQGWLTLTPAGIEAMESKATEFAQMLQKLREVGYDHTLSAQYMLAGGLARR